MAHVLTLAFSNTGSMAAYRAAGSYGPFVARLKEYAACFDVVHVCTFDTEDYTAQWGLPNVRHHRMPRIPATSVWYHVLSPLIHRRSLRDTTVIRTFNVTGGLPALINRAFTGAPVCVSYGYSLPAFVRSQSGWLKVQAYRAVEAIALRGSDCILCATPAQCHKLAAAYGPSKVVWLPNYVDTEQFRPLGESAGDYLLFVGRLAVQKNVESLLRALRLALDRGSKLPPAVIIGSGNQAAMLHCLAEELRLPVQFCGTVPNDELPAWYARAWAYILPSHFEGMPKTLLEAMSSGVPCIGTNIEGIRELITDGRNGLLVEPSPQSIAAGLCRLYGDETLRRSIAAQARQTVVERYSMSQVLGREITLLLELSR